MEMKSDTCGNGEIMLFGVRVVVDSMKKSVSWNNLSQFEQPHHQPQAHQDGEVSNNSSNKIQSKDDVAAGYASADDAVPSSRATRVLMSTIPKRGSQIAADNFEAEPTLDSNQDTLCTISLESDKMNKKETTEKYEVVTHLGSGAFGEVSLVENKVTKERFAMKCIKRGQKVDKYVAREINIQKWLCHSNVIQFMEVVLTLSYLGIVMEYAKGGDLHKEIFESSSKKGLDENMARYYFKQLVSGVSYLHSNGVCHRDLTPGNILLDGSDPPCLKICDFGFSKSSRLHSKPKSEVGTPQYRAPEVREREYDGMLADLWSCGAILYAMLVGKHPTYRPNDIGETSNVDETNACPVFLPKSLSRGSKDLLARMLVVDPRKRITMEDVKEHMWLKKKMKRKLPEATQVTKENPRLSLQSDEEIDKIFKEAQIRLTEDAIGIEEDVESILTISSDEEAQIHLPEDAIGMEEDDNILTISSDEEAQIHLPEDAIGMEEDDKSTFTFEEEDELARFVDSLFEDVRTHPLGLMNMR